MLQGGPQPPGIKWRLWGPRSRVFFFTPIYRNLIFGHENTCYPKKNINFVHNPNISRSDTSPKWLITKLPKDCYDHFHGYPSRVPGRNHELTPFVTVFFGGPVCGTATSVSQVPWEYLTCWTNGAPTSLPFLGVWRSGRFVSVISFFNDFWKKSSRNFGKWFMIQIWQLHIFQNELVQPPTSYNSCGFQLKSMGLTGVKNLTYSHL